MNRLEIAGQNNNVPTNLVLTANIQDFKVMCENGTMKLSVLVPCFEPASYRVTVFEYCQTEIRDIEPDFMHYFNEETSIDKLTFKLKMDSINKVIYETIS